MQQILPSLPSPPPAFCPLFFQLLFFFMPCFFFLCCHDPHSSEATSSTAFSSSPPGDLGADTDGEPAAGTACAQCHFSRAPWRCPSDEPQDKGSRLAGMGSRLEVLIQRGVPHPLVHLLHPHPPTAGPEGPSCSYYLLIANVSKLPVH